MNESSRRTLKRVSWGLLGAAAVAATAWAYWPQPLAVDCETVRRGDLVSTVVEDGRTRVRDRYTVSAPLTGVLQRPEVRAGDAIRRGDVIARILPSVEPLLNRRSHSEAQARVLAAEAGLKRAEAAVGLAEAAAQFAESELARRRSLVRSNVLSASEFDRLATDVQARKAELEAARFGARVAEHELALARTALRRSTGSEAAEELEIKAPIDGRILEIFNESETALAPGTPILSLGDPAHLEIVVDVLTRDAVRIEAHADATIDRWGGARPLQARVVRVEPSAFTEVSALGVEEQRVNVILDLESPHQEWSALGDGFRVEAEIVLERRSDVLTVPTSALFRHRGAWSTFRVDQGVARRVPLELGASTDRYAEVASGLEPDQCVIIYPNDLVADGVRVQATRVQE